MENTHLFLEYIILSLEFIGVIVIFGGVVVGVARGIINIKLSKKHIYTHIREEIGRAILLGLEILIAVDIIKTVTTELTLESVVNLGIIVIIRTFLSISLGVEIERKFPWQDDTKKDK